MSLQLNDSTENAILKQNAEHEVHAVDVGDPKAILKARLAIVGDTLLP